MSEVVTMKRDLLPPDKRVVFSKYREDHQALLKEAAIANMPTSINDIGDAIENVRAAMLKSDIAMYVDSYWDMFNILWDEMPVELKPTQTETETINEPDHATLAEAH